MVPVPLQLRRLRIAATLAASLAACDGSGPEPQPEDRPSDEEILENSDTVRHLAGYLLRRNADHVRTALRNGRSVLEFHFQH